MRLFCMTVLVLCLSSQRAQCSYEDDIVDPTDMLNYDRSTRSMRRPKPKTAGSDPVHNDRCTVFLSRFVNILLKNTGLSENLNYNKGSNEDVKSRVSLTLSVQDLQLLENMVINKDIDYIEIDRILNAMFTVEKEGSFGFEMGNGDNIINEQAKTVLYWILVSSILLFCIYIVFQNIRFVFSVPFVAFIIFLLAFGSTWYTMYMKAEINRSVHLEYMPSHCHQNTKGWFSWFKNHDLDECKRYKEAIYLDPKYSIALTEILAEMFSKILMKPIETLGDTIHVFNKSVLRDFPMWAQIILIPIFIIVIVKTTLLACALLVGRHLSIKSMFGYGSTSIGSGSSNNERFTTNNRNFNSSTPMTSRHTDAQIPGPSKINFNINFMQPSSNLPSISNRREMRHDDFSFNYNNSNINYNKREKNLLAMLKNKDIDSVDNKNSHDLIVKRSRHRTLSI